MGPKNFEAAGKVAAKRLIRARLGGKEWDCLAFYYDYALRHKIDSNNKALHRHFWKGFKSIKQEVART